MKLAEALLERADLLTKINALESRLMNNSKVQEGLKPNEEPSKLLNELDEKIERLNFLIVQINKTNENTYTKDGKTLSSLLSLRDSKTIKLRILGNFIQSGSMLVNRNTHTEIKILSTFNISDMQKKIDDLSKEIRQIDTKIQELNWTTELL